MRVALLLACVSASYMGSKPNVLIFFADDLGYGDVSFNGHPTVRTPALNQLASEGIRFTQWYSAFHVCSPSRASMLTGRLPVRVGIAGDWTGSVLHADAKGGLPANETTFAEALKDVGYATAAVGKWHLGQQHKFLPLSHGFDQYLGIPYSVDMGASAWDYYNDTERPPLPLLNGFEILEQPADLNKVSDSYAAFASEFIANNTRDKKPWLLYYAFNHVHTPDFAGPQFCNTSKRGRFGDAVESMDFAVGQVMAALKNAGGDEDTIVFFCSDNGPWLVRQLAGGSAGLFRDGKQTTWEGGVRSPGVVRWPGKITPRVSLEVVATYDIFPTILKLAGASLPSVVLDGLDMAPVLFDPKAVSSHKCIFIYKGTPRQGCPKSHPKCPGLWAVRCGQYKMHYVTSNWTTGTDNGHFEDPPLLFNIEFDPSEAWPISSDSQEYKNQSAIIQEAVTEHEAGLILPEDQILLGQDPNLKICCDPESPKKYPAWPNCTCNPENFQVFVCKPVGPCVEVDCPAL